MPCFARLLVTLALLLGLCCASKLPSQRCNTDTPSKEADRLAIIHFQAGRTQSTAGKSSDAVNSFRAALECRPNMGEAYYHMGLELQRGEKLEEAVRAMHKAAKSTPELAGDAFAQVGYWHSLAGDGEGALDGFSRAVKSNPKHYHAWSNMGVVLQQAGRFPEALEAYKKCANVNPDYAQNFFNMGKVHQDLGQVREAVDAFKRAVDTSPTYFEAYASLGGALTPMRKWTEASAILTDALLLEPRSPEALYLLAFALMHICQWKHLDKVLQRLHVAVRARMSSAQNPGVEPYAALTFPWDPVDLRAIAEYHARQPALQAAALLGHTLRWSHAKLGGAPPLLSVGIKSFDIGDHQSSYLMSAVLAQLASRRHAINLLVYCLRPDDKSELRRGIQEAVGSDSFFDVSALPTIEIAEKINDDQVHVLVDMDAHFRGSRIQVLSLLPAPVQMVYPFFVGTSGAEYLPLSLNDKIATPPEYVAHFNEKLVYLPNSYYVNSHAQAFESRPPPPLQHGAPGTDAREIARVRKEEGLPEEGEVLCNFNQIYKVDAVTYAAWMQLLLQEELDQDETATLWLRAEGEDTHQVLHTVAKRFGIETKRIVFARWAPTSDSHVRRTAVASLSLDTPLYNSMTTGCDVLWSGVPLVSYAGEKMVSRLGASLLLALQVPSLLVRDVSEYLAVGRILLRAAARRAAAAKTAAAVSTAGAGGEGEGGGVGEGLVAASGGPHARRVARLEEALKRGRTESPLYDMSTKADEMVGAFRLAWDLYAMPAQTRDRSGGRPNAIDWAKHLVVSRRRNQLQHLQRGETVADADEERATAQHELHVNGRSLKSAPRDSEWGRSEGGRQTNPDAFHIRVL